MRAPRLSPLFALLLAVPAFGGPREGAFLDQYCIDCHDSGEKKGGLDLEALEWNPGQPENFEEWAKIWTRVSKGEMPPPKKKSRPEPAAAHAFLDQMGGALRGLDAAREATEGRTILRRLNRIEYENTLHDLLGIDTPLATLLPYDTPAHGFDTVAEGLRFSAMQMEKYLEAADVALDAAINFGPEPKHVSLRWNPKEDPEIRKNVDTPQGQLANPKEPKSAHHQTLRELDDAVVYFDRGYPPAQPKTLGAHPAGRFRIRISGYGFQSAGRNVAMRVYVDNYREKQLLGWYEMPPDHARVVEIETDLNTNQHVRVEPSYTGVDEKGQGVYNLGAREFTGPGLALQWMKLEGPLDAAWPPKSLALAFGELPVTKIAGNQNRDRRTVYEIAPAEPKAAARATLEAFALRAFRRPLRPGEIDRFAQLSTEAIDGGAHFVEAVRVGLRAILTAPQFLLFEEQPGRLDDYALASRLSYFLWSTLPDERLLTLAGQHRLHDPAVLREQTERMLGDPRSAAFVRNFTGQWLDLRSIDATSPDKALYPEADELLIHSMVRETESFFAELLKENLPVTNLIQSNFAMLNSRLAVHYGVPGVEGEAIRKVALPPESVRGGLLTQASILKVTANGTTTSPVRRGAWVMKKLLGDPPPPPPAGIAAIEPDTRGATTVREQLAKHRTSATCAGCHSHIDPPGFALECFDVIGGLRDRYRAQGQGPRINLQDSPDRRLYVQLGLPVQCDGELPDGRAFTGIQDFKKLLLENSGQVMNALTANLVTYSTGAGISFGDRFTAEQIATRTQAEGGGLRTLIRNIILSPLFQNK